MDIRVRRLSAQFTKDTKTPNEYIKFTMSEDNPGIWYALLHSFDGESDEFKGGQYLVRIEATDKFPHSPPWFYFMTENGVYGCDKKVCISIGGYHEGEFRAVLSLGDFTKQLISGMIGWKDLGSGINILDTTAEQKKLLADASVGSNMEKYPDIIKRIEETYAEYSKKWVASKLAS